MIRPHFFSVHAPLTNCYVEALAVLLYGAQHSSAIGYLLVTWASLLSTRPKGRLIRQFISSMAKELAISKTQDKR
jgi:hypothetical protein